MQLIIIKSFSLPVLYWASWAPLPGTQGLRLSSNGRKTWIKRMMSSDSALFLEHSLASKKQVICHISRIFVLQCNCYSDCWDFVRMWINFGALSWDEQLKIQLLDSAWLFTTSWAFLECSCALLHCVTVYALNARLAKCALVNRHGPGYVKISEICHKKQINNNLE